MSSLTDFAPSLQDAEPLPHGGTCPSCGAPVESLDRFCPTCGAERPVEAQVVQAAPQKHFRCQNCGAEVGIDPDQRSLTCPFCESNYVVEFSPQQSGRMAPEFVVGFAVTRDGAKEKFRQWIAENSFFRPGDLRNMAIEEKLRGVYLPFWSFSMLARSSWSASIGEYWYRTETYTTTENGKTVTKTRTVRETEWWPLSGKHHRYYSGYLVSGSRGLPQAEAHRIGPFHLAALKRYRPYFLAGWLSEEYSVGRDEALRACQEEFHRREQRNIASHLPGDTHRSLQVTTSFDHVNSDLILLPIHILNYRYRDKVYRFLVNGQTGKVTGEKPLSWTRIWTVVGATLAAIALVAGTVALIGALAR